MLGCPRIMVLPTLLGKITQRRGYTLHLWADNDLQLKYEFLISFSSEPRRTAVFI